MQKRYLGPNKLAVSAMGLGCMGMSASYGQRNDPESIKTIHAALDAGVTLLDTADIYGNGHNEELVGKAIKDRRNQVVLATKTGFVPTKPGAKFGTHNNSKDYSFTINGTPEYIKEACDNSLRRLAVDVIDLYYLHRVDKNVPIEESVGVLADLVKAGIIRYIGLSEVTAATLRRAAKVHPITALQTEYSLWQRKPEQEILATCRELKISFVAYSPLGRGFLTAKIDDLSNLEANDIRHHMPKFQQENLAANLKIVSAIKALAEQKNCTPAQLALAWLLAQGDDIVPIPGTKQQRYLQENIQALQIQLTQKDLSYLDELTVRYKVAGAQYPEHLNFEV